MKNIPVSKPLLYENEVKNVIDALNQKAISGFYGEYISKFESGFSNYSGCSYGISTSSGTTALHLAMATLSIKKDDEVIVSTLTNMASVFSILYQGAIPIPIDIEADTLNINPELIIKRITARTKAILVVHLFGHPVNMDPIVKIANDYNLFIIEDCAQAHGARYKNKKVGSIGHIGCFSFYANKIITTGEGGMLVTNDGEIAERARMLKNLAFGDKIKFMHKDIGYNYRMTNLQAAIGCAQLEKIEEFIRQKRNIAEFYTSELCVNPFLKLPIEKSYAFNVYWMYHIILVGELKNKRNILMEKLKNKGIETREGFIPCNMQEIFLSKGLVKLEDCPIANNIAFSSFYLPSSPDLNNDELEYITTCLLDFSKSISKKK